MEEKDEMAVIQNGQIVLIDYLDFTDDVTLSHQAYNNKEVK